MIAIAGVLLLIVVVFSVAVVISNPAILDLSIFGAHLPATAAGVYFTGAGAMLVFVLALDLLRRGVRREVRRRRRVKSLQAVASGVTREGRDPEGVRGGGVPREGVPREGLNKEGVGMAGAGGAGVGASTTAASSSTGERRPSSSTHDRHSSGQEHEALSTSAEARQGSGSQDSGSRITTGRPAGATALGSASLPERQALLDEAEELTGDDYRR